MAHISQGKIDQIRNLARGGASVRQIAILVGCSKDTANSYVIKYRDDAAIICDHNIKTFLCSSCRPNGRWNRKEITGLGSLTLPSRQQMKDGIFSHVEKRMKRLKENMRDDEMLVCVHDLQDSLTLFEKRLTP